MRFPDLSGEKVIAIDIETKDPLLKAKGPGVYRKDGYIAGFSLATKGGFSEYYNLRHPGERSHSEDQVLSYLKKVMALPCHKIGANIMYDFDWIQNGYGIQCNGEWIDIQVAEALIDENQGFYSLDYMAKKYLGLSKNDKGINEWALHNGIKETAVKNNIYKIPYRVVKPYGIADAELPLKIFEKQREILLREDLMKLFLDVETPLLKVLLDMRKLGVLIDQEELARLIKQAEREIPVKIKEVERIAGCKININSHKQLSDFFTRKHIEKPTKSVKDKKGVYIDKVSFDNACLSACNHPIAKAIQEAREVLKVHGTFLTRNIRDMIAHDGRIHGSFHSAKGDDNGTVTGRLSGSNPNLQQLINPEKRWGHLIRGLYVPEKGCQWGKIDYSQIEVRVLAHYAKGLDSDKIREAFCTNPKQDYHSWTASVIAGLPMDSFMKLPDWRHRRKQAKSINFGIMYGMGKEKLKMQLGVDDKEGERILKEYRRALPFIMQTSNMVRETGEARGYIKTILSRRRRFPIRKFAYKGLNALVQGSAADIMKKAMVDCYKAGIFKELPLHLTVHDELNNSIPEGKEKVFREMKEIMENCVPLNVPIIADAEIGSNWANVKEFI